MGLDDIEEGIVGCVGTGGDMDGICDSSSLCGNAHETTKPGRTGISKCY